MKAFRQVVAPLRKLRVVLITFAMTTLCLAGCIGGKTKRLTPDQIMLSAETISKPALLEKIKAASVGIKTLVITNSTLKVTQKIAADQLKEFGKGVFKPDGIIFVERPDKLRLQVELSGITGADMQSDERQFKVYVPHGLNAFGIGSVSAPVGDVSFPCNLRPNHILDALFVDGEKYMDNPAVNIARREQSEGIRSYYLIDFIRNDSFVQELWYDRTDKQVTRKIQYAEDGRPEAIVRYSNFTTIGSIQFPKSIEINRPIEQYTLEMTINEMVFNEPISPDKFQLDRPAGTNDLDMKTCKPVKP